MSFKPLEIEPGSDEASIERQIREQLKAQGLQWTDAEVNRKARELAREERR